MKTNSMYSLLILSIGLLLTGCGVAQKDYELDARSFTSGRLKMIEQKTGIAIPDGSHGLNLYFDQSHIDPSFMAKIEIPTTSREIVFNQLEQIPARDGGVTNPLREKLSWWNPSATTVRIKRIFIHPQSNWGGELLLCEEGGRWILYVDWSAG